MGKWRVKFVFLLLVYAAGFLTAIYMLVPPSESGFGNEGFGSSQASFTSVFSADRLMEARQQCKESEFLRSLSSVMHKCLGYGKEQICYATKLIKQKCEERWNKN